MTLLNQFTRSLLLKYEKSYNLAYIVCPGLNFHLSFKLNLFIYMSLIQFYVLVGLYLNVFFGVKAVTLKSVCVEFSLLVGFRSGVDLSWKWESTGRGSDPPWKKQNSTHQPKQNATSNPHCE